MTSFSLYFHLDVKLHFIICFELLFPINIHMPNCDYLGIHWQHLTYIYIYILRNRIGQLALQNTYILLDCLFLCWWLMFGCAVFTTVRVVLKLRFTKGSVWNNKVPKPPATIQNPVSPASLSLHDAPLHTDQRQRRVLVDVERLQEVTDVPRKLLLWYVIMCYYYRLVKLGGS